MRLLLVFFCLALTVVVYAAPAHDDDSDSASDENVSIHVKSDCCDWKKQCTCRLIRDGVDAVDGDDGGEVSDGYDGKKNCNCTKYMRCCLLWHPVNGDWKKGCCRKWDPKCCANVDKDTEISVHVKCCDGKKKCNKKCKHKCHKRTKRSWPWPTRDGGDSDDEDDGGDDDGGDDSGDDDDGDDADDGNSPDHGHKKRCHHPHHKKDCCCEDQNITIKLKVDDCCCKRKHKKKKCHKKHPHKHDDPKPSDEPVDPRPGIVTESSDSVEFVVIGENGDITVKQLGPFTIPFGNKPRWQRANVKD